MLQLRLLGSTDVVDDNGQPQSEAMRRPKVLAVLAYLAVARPRGMHRRDKVAALFWPELPSDRARAALRVTLTRMRDDLGAGLICARGAHEIGVDAAHLDCDAVALDEALARNDVDEAVRLYRGHFMSGVHVQGAAEELEDWMSLERQRLRDATRQLLIAGATALEKNGDAAGAQDLLRRATEIAPADETASRMLIELLVAGGDRAGALAVYTELERNLARSFEVAPSDAVRALGKGLRSGSNAVIVAERAPAAPRFQRRWPRNWALGMLAGSVVTLLLLNVGAIARDRRIAAEGAPAVATWEMIAPFSRNSRPAGRIGGGAALDSTGGVIVFGGQFYMPDSARPTNDLWRLQGLEPGHEAYWTRLNPSGELPRPRWLFGMASDPAHDRIIVHGGAFGATSPCASDTWVLDHVTGRPTWRRVPVRGPTIPPRAGYEASFDAASNRLVVFGGHDCISTFYNETWVLVFDDSTLASGRWLRLDVDTTHGAPASRTGYGSAYDATHRRLFVHGGSQSGQPLPGLWALEHADGSRGRAAWRSVHCRGIGPSQNGEVAAFDEASSTLLIFGGQDSTAVYRRELWRVTGLDGDPTHCRWERVPQNEPSPSARGRASLMVDRRTHSVVLFGGMFNDNGFSDTWVLREFPSPTSSPSRAP